jgi:4-hydroxy-tetrahydrodipicolinate synthase
MNNGKVDWHGNHVDVVTPFQRDGAMDETRFKANIARLRDEGAHGFVVCGSAGEAWSLEPGERLQLFRWAREVCGPGLPLIGGTSLTRTDRTVELARAAMAAGCDGVMLTPPSGLMLGEREIAAHVETISREVAAPICLHNSPKRTGINMSPAFLATLSKIEWVVALTQSTEDFNEFEATLGACGDRISVFAGHTAEHGFAAVVMGATGLVSSLEPQVMGREAIALHDLAKAGQVEEGRHVQRRCITLEREMRQVGAFPANLKAAMNLLKRDGGFCRTPLLDLNETETARIAMVLERSGLIGRSVAA